MKTINIFSALVICVLSFSCSKEVPPTQEVPSPAPPKEFPGFTVNNQFGLRLYGEIYKSSPDSNLCVSPFSIRTCLSLVANGTTGEDLKEILKALKLPDGNLEAINEDYENLVGHLVRVDPRVTYESANSFWHQNGLHINPLFKTDLSHYYQADVFPVDFTSSLTLGLMNDWVTAKTHGKITEIARVIPPNTIMNLTNAIYFNGEWTYKFDRKGTKPWSFKRLDRTYADMAVMSNIQKYRYYEHPNWYGLEMTYGNGAWAMYLFLPHQAGPLDKLTPWLIENWDQIRNEFVSDQPILIRVPQFQMECNFELKPVWKALGINRIFNPGANFSRMMADFVYLASVTHKTYIKVNEDGTEAAAITSAWGVGGGPPGLFFDHPFTWLIAERSTGTVLFIGQVTDPSRNK
jgi:serpin B